MLKTTKKVVIAGCRDYTNYEEAKVFIDFCLSNIKMKYKIVIVSGCASARMLSERDMLKRIVLRLKNTLQIGKDTAKVQDQ